MIYHFSKTNPRKNKHLKSVVKGLPLFFGNYYLKLFRVGCYDSMLLKFINNKNIIKMREIKFRGKKKNGTWLFGDLVQRPPIALIFPLDAPDSQDNYIVDLKTVGQFTGLTDKNGVEIYEGDICEVEYYSNVATKENNYLNQVVELNCCDYVLKAKEKPINECSIIEIVCHINSLSIIHRNDFNRIKVIGNIYENPELL